MEENNYMEKVIENHTEDEEIDSKTNVIGWSIFIGILLIIGFFTNPGAEEHQDKVDEIVESFERSHSHKTKTFEVRAEAPQSLSHLNYHSLGVLSFTTADGPDTPGIMTVGVFGYIHPLFKIGF